MPVDHKVMLVLSPANIYVDCCILEENMNIIIEYVRNKKLYWEETDVHLCQSILGSKDDAIHFMFRLT